VKTAAIVPKEPQGGARLVERGPMPGAVRAESQPRVEPAATAQPATRSPPEPALAPAPDYLLGARLDPGPRPLGSIEPEYPESANLQEGKVVLRLLISDTGVVDEAAVVRAEPKGLFENAALDAFRVARFSPGMVLGTPVKSQITVEVEFLPINRGARISGRMY
jgi:protein TonB